MSFFNGNICAKILAIALFLSLILTRSANCQQGILDSTFTFRSGTIRTGDALDIITRQTGYNFTYDSRLIDQDKKTQMSFKNTRLIIVLDSILKNDSLVFSVIDKYIIISHAEKRASLAADSTDAGRIKYITGKIIDEATSEPLPFATIALKNTGKGTVTNNNGDFGLKITSDYIDDTLSVSYLGFIVREIPVKKAFGNNFTISMKREYIAIPEIIIKSQNPQDIISRALKAIPQNYGDTPALMTGFYREGVLKKSELQTYTEAILEIYKSAYSGTLLGDQIKVYKSRKVREQNSVLGVKTALIIYLMEGISLRMQRGNNPQIS